MRVRPSAAHGRTVPPCFAPAYFVPATLPRVAGSTVWQQGLPTLSTQQVTLRELRLSDARSLQVMLTSEDVARYISAPPSTVDGFEQFIVWTHAERQEGRYIYFAIVPRGMDAAIGIIHVRLRDVNSTGEWGFAIGSAFWGTGLFTAAATLMLDFAFDVVGVQRLEARAAVENRRGNAALRRMGAVCEGVLRRSFARNGQQLDQNLWSILDCDWQELRASGATPGAQVAIN